MEKKFFAVLLILAGIALFAFMSLAGNAAFMPLHTLVPSITPWRETTPTPSPTPTPCPTPTYTHVQLASRHLVDAPYLLKRNLEYFLIANPPSEAKYYAIKYWIESSTNASEVIVQVYGLQLQSPDEAWDKNNPPLIWYGAVCVNLEDWRKSYMPEQ